MTARSLSADFIAGLDACAAQSLSDESRRQVSMCVVDYLACVHLGQSLASGGTSEYLALMGDSDGGSKVIGTGRRAPVQVAAMVNGIHAHVAELDDGHRYGMVHVGAPVISALLAAAGVAPMDGERFLLGVAMGYEAVIRLASAIQPGHKLRGFHATGTCGAVGAALGVAYALDFDEAEKMAVLSAAATGAAGLLEVTSGASTLKPYNVGRAAADALGAAFMGRAGFSGPQDILGGDRGFLRAVAGEIDERALLEGLGGDLALHSIYRKPYAACRHCHAAIEAAMVLARDKDLSWEDVIGVEVRTYGLAVDGHDHVEVEGPASAKMSIPYSVAAALVFGGAGYEQFGPDCIADARLRSLIGKVAVRESAELSALVPAKRAAEVEIETAMGSFARRVDYPKGEPENPITRDELDSKFLSLMAASGRDGRYACELLECAWRIEERFADLLDMLQ